MRTYKKLGCVVIVILVFIVCFRALYFVIFVLHMLAFFEAPSSLSWTSDLRQKIHRVVLPCGVTETIELLCLLVLLVDLIAKVSKHVDYGINYFINCVFWE